MTIPEPAQLFEFLLAGQRAKGFSHVAALAERGGDLRNIRIGPRSPKSCLDRSVLGLSRILANAVVISGKTLREEPDLRYGFEPGSEEIRCQILGDVSPPTLIVLTRNRRTVEQHPALSGQWPVVFREDVASIARLKNDFERISIEAGPTVSIELHSLGVIDELLLSIYTGELDAAAVGQAVPDWRKGLHRRGTELTEAQWSVACYAK